MRSPRPYSRKLRQFKHLSRKADRMMRSGEFQALPERKKDHLIARLDKLFRALKEVYDPSILKRVMAGAALLIGLNWGTAAKGQSFASPQGNPFGLSDAPPYYPSLAQKDLDNDGDLDLLFHDVYQGASFAFIENTGSASSPSFGTVVSQPFGLDTVPSNAIGGIDLSDLDADGDLDLMLADYYNSPVYYYENTGTAGSPQFATPQDDPYGLGSMTAYVDVVEFSDLDNDGDPDLLGSGSYPGTGGGASFFFFENTGSASSPSFNFSGNVNPFGLTNSSSNVIAFPSLSDLDEDGDMDLLVNGTYIQSAQDTLFAYYENTGSASNPSFSSPTYGPFGLEIPSTGVQYFYDNAAVDLDNDGDLDLMVGGAFYKDGFYYYENTGTSSLLGSASKEKGSILYPQPAKQHLNIILEGKDKLRTYSVLDAKGSLLLKKEGRGRKRVRLTVSDLEPGIYFLKGRSTEGSFIRKFMVR